MDAHILGQTLRFLRTHMLRPNGRPLTQQMVYAACRALEAKAREKNKLEGDDGEDASWVFKAKNQVHQRTVIGKWEKGDERPPPGARRILEQFFEVPLGFLDSRVTFSDGQLFDDFVPDGDEHPYPETRDYLVARIESHIVVSEPVVDPPPMPPPLEPRPTFIATLTKLKRTNLNGIPSWTRDDPFTPAYQSLRNSIQQGLVPEENRDLRIFSLQGPSGVGKTRVMTEWWHEQGRLSFEDGIFSLDCSSLSGDQIIRALTSHFLGVEREQIDMAFVEKLREFEKPLVVLDGLAAVGTQSKLDGGLSLPTSDSLALDWVRKLLFDLCRLDARLSLLVILQTEQTGDALQARSRLTAQADYLWRLVEPLTDTQGAHLLRQLGVTQIGTDDLKRIAVALMGYPIFLVWAGKIINEADPNAQEAFITRLTLRDQDFHHIAEFFRKYVSSLGAQGSDEEAHPHAFLRLLSLMPGPVSKRTIDNILDEVPINRLRRAQVDMFLQRRNSFVRDMGDRIDIHPVLRQLFRHELAKISTGEIVDPTTPPEELATIHAVAASQCLRSLPDRTKELTSAWAEMAELAIYHLLALRDFLDQGAQPPSTTVPALLECDSDEACRRIRTRNITAHELTQYCLEKLAKQYLFATDKARVIGQYETRARILTYFLDRHQLDGQARYLTPAQQRQLFFHNGICWMHCGRLHSAERALVRALDVSPRPSKTLGAPTPNMVAQLSADAKQSCSWRDWANVISPLSLVRVRSGDHAGRVSDGLRADLQLAVAISKQAPKEHVARPVNQVLLHAARRVIGRQAHIDLFRGDLHSALKRFELVTQMGQPISLQYAEGETARRYAHTLVRMRTEIPDAVQRAVELIDFNYNHLLKRETEGFLPSDILPCLITRATLARVSGNLNQAHQFLDMARLRAADSKMEMTYASTVDLELETARLKIARGLTTDDAERLKGDLLIRALESKQRQHALHANECDLLAAELSTSVGERNQLLERAELNMIASGWMLRVIDIERLRAGKSAVEVCGW